VSTYGWHERLELAEEKRRQVAALPYRRTATGDVEVLLTTSRGGKRFMVPKGWASKKEGDANVAARKAFEEAGVTGRIGRRPIGDYVHWKSARESASFVKVDVYALKVRKQRRDWPERGVRECGWFHPSDAAAVVASPGLTALLRACARDGLGDGKDEK
jgi:8-oxo-dGTP pyrophosphatase MutT (NUDIX family)